MQLLLYFSIQKKIMVFKLKIKNKIYEIFFYLYLFIFIKQASLGK